MNSRGSRIVWCVVGLVVALVLGLLWVLQQEPERAPGLEPNPVASAETTSSALRAVDAVASDDVESTPVAERNLASVDGVVGIEEDVAPPWVEGIVVHAGGEGALADIELQVWARMEPRNVGGIEPESTHWVANGRSGADGRFALPRSLIPAGWHSGSAPQLAILQVDVPGFRRFQAPFPPLGEESAKVMVRLEPSSVLIGRVVRVESGPLPDAKVVLEVHPPRPLEGAPPAQRVRSQIAKVANATSNQTGRFRLEIGDRPLQSIQGPVEAIRIHITHGEHGEARVELPPNKLAELRTARGQHDVDLGDVALDTLDWSAVEVPPVIAGQLLDPEGAAIRVPNLRILGEGKVPAEKPLVRAVATDAEGHFSVVGLYGEHIVVGSQHPTLREALGQGEGVEVAVAPGEPVQVVWPMHRVRPRLLDRNGTPIQGANVHLVSKSAARSEIQALTLEDGIAQDFYAPPGETVQVLATLPLGQVVRATVHVPDRPYLTTVDLVRDDAPPGTLRLTLDPPLDVTPAMSAAQAFAQGGAQGIALQFSDGETGVGLSVGRESPKVLGPGRAEVTLAPGSYRLQLARLPKGYAPLRDPPRFEIASGETLELTVQVERSAMLHLVPLDSTAAALLGGPIDVGELMRRTGALEELSEPSPGSPAPLLVWNPAATVREGPYRVRGEELPAGRYTLRWRWKDGEQWIGEIQLEPGIDARVEVAGPAAAEASVGHRWLSLRRE
ncbi:MAG: hypothetical protein GC161_10910 [Planctomycetaceae bacterium]|nr:hypothetical protein [Planctomycetaceae bacterium]